MQFNAGGLLVYFMEVSPYDDFILEAADTNTSAVHTYEKAGFVEFTREPAPVFYITCNKNSIRLLP